MDQSAPNGDAALFNIEDVFDEDYLHFYSPLLTPERTEQDADTLSELLRLEPGEHILDIGCGHGRIANALARRHLKVTGLDRTAQFLALARADSARLSLGVDYVEGDMRVLPWQGAFDAAYIWFTTFGYFDDAENERVLASAATALKPGGRLLIEQVNRTGLIRRGLPRWCVVEVGTDLLIDKVDYDPFTDCSNAVRTTVRNGIVKRANYAVRLYGPAEITRRLLKAGFETVEILGQDGAPFTLNGNRIIAIAWK